MGKRGEGWALLKEKKYDEAIRLFYRDYAEEALSSCLNNASFAYLLKGEPESAAKLAETVITREDAGTGEYGLAGVARWLSGDYTTAVSHWKKGQGAAYADASGGMGLPLLLAYAAVRQPNVIPFNEVKTLLKRQLWHPWASRWPGPLGAFMLDEMDESSIRELTVFSHKDAVDAGLVTRQRVMQLGFYVGVKAAAIEDISCFRSQMKQCASTLDCETKSEFYLARHEMSISYKSEGSV